MGNGIAGIDWLRGMGRAALAALTGAVVVLAVAPPARAGTYEVWSCRGPDGEALPTEAWSLTTFDEPPGGGIVLDDACASGGALTLAIDPAVRFSAPLKPTALAILDLPAAVRVRSYDLRWSLRTAPAGLLSDFYYAAGVRERAGGPPSDFGCASVQRPQFPCTESGDPSDPDHPSNQYARSGLQLDGLELFAGCTTDGCTGLLPLLRDGEVAAELTLFGARVELEDAVAPTLVGLGGSLASGQPVAGTGSLVVEGADAGGGIAAVSVSIDGGPPQTQALPGPDGACAAPYTRAKPCPPEATRAFAVEVDELEPGPHGVAGTIVDAAGNVTSFGPVAFTVAEPAAASPVPVAPPAPPARPLPPARDLRNGRPAVARPRLRIVRARIDHRRGRPAGIAGTLRTPGGRPIAGARLTLTAEPIGRPGAEVALDPVVTTAGGRFRTRVPGDGARRVKVAFAPTIGGAPTVSATAIVRQRARLGIARSRSRVPRGGAVTLSGRLRGAGVASREAVVELQAIVSGRWRAVATVRTNGAGRYRWRYRFRYVTRDTVFSFRALVRRTPGWPWPTLASRPLRVRVDGA